MKKDALIRAVSSKDLEHESLKDFDRYQETRIVKRKNPDGSFVYLIDEFIDDWDSKRKTEVVDELKRCLLSGGFVAGAFLEGSLVGFASIENGFFGIDNQYLEMTLMHVSRELRGFGIGRRLFDLCCQAAKNRGARKLYISSHPSFETQVFYESLGCVSACEINEEVYSREPLDIQLEFKLDI